MNLLCIFLFVFFVQFSKLTEIEISDNRRFSTLPTEIHYQATVNAFDSIPPIIKKQNGDIVKCRLSDKDLEKIILGNWETDDEYEDRNKDDSHQNDEYLELSWERVKRKLNTAMSLIDTNVDKAFYVIGNAFHMVQDFYSHSSYADVYNNMNCPTLNWGSGELGSLDVSPNVQISPECIPQYSSKTDDVCEWDTSVPITNPDGGVYYEQLKFLDNGLITSGFTNYAYIRSVLIDIKHPTGNGILALLNAWSDRIIQSQGINISMPQLCYTPEGKCRHILSVGPMLCNGISKDYEVENGIFNPLYQQSAEFAKEASITLLKNFFIKLGASFDGNVMNIIKTQKVRDRFSKLFTVCNDTVTTIDDTDDTEPYEFYDITIIDDLIDAMSTKTVEPLIRPAAVPSSFLTFRPKISVNDFGFWEHSLQDKTRRLVLYNTTPDEPLAIIPTFTRDGYPMIFPNHKVIEFNMKKPSSDLWNLRRIQFEMALEFVHDNGDVFSRKLLNNREFNPIDFDINILAYNFNFFRRSTTTFKVMIIDYDDETTETNYDLNIDWPAYKGLKVDYVFDGIERSNSKSFDVTVTVEKNYPFDDINIVFIGEKQIGTHKLSTQLSIEFNVVEKKNYKEFSDRKMFWVCDFDITPPVFGGKDYDKITLSHYEYVNTNCLNSLPVDDEYIDKVESTIIASSVIKLVVSIAILGLCFVMVV